MMAKIPENRGKPWTPGDVKKLEQLANQNTPTGVIGLKLKRTPEAVQQKASRKASRPSPRTSLHITGGKSKSRGSVVLRQNWIAFAGAACQSQIRSSFI